MVLNITSKIMYLRYSESYKSIKDLQYFKYSMDILEIIGIQHLNLPLSFNILNGLYCLLQACM